MLPEEQKTQPEEKKNMVVVGRIGFRTDTHIGVVYQSQENTESILVINRQDLTETPSTGMMLPPSAGANRAYAFSKAICPSCNNEASQRRSVLITEDEEGNEHREVIKCQTCDGKGHVSDFPTQENHVGHDYTPVIDDELHTLTDGLAYGNLPDAHHPIFRGQFSGGRGGRTDDWDSHIVARNLGAVVDGEFSPVVEMKNGTPTFTLIQHFNEAYATPEMPLGEPIGRTKTDVYATRQHREMFEDFINHCEAAGLRYNLWGANKGQDAYMDIMLAEKGTREEVIGSLRSLREAARMSEDIEFPRLRDNPNAVISFGIQLHHSFDGAFTVRGIAQRVACLNGMVATDAKNLLSLMHKKGIMDAIVMSELVPMLISAAFDLYGEILQVDAMNDLVIDQADFESILVLAQKRGILSFPSIGKNNQLTGGRVFRAATQGWADPSVPWVSVGQGEGDSAQTLNHIYNIFTGIITHQVEARDLHGNVTGGKAIGINRVQSQLMEVHRMCRDIQNTTYEAARDAGCTTAEDIAEWVAYNGHPMLNDTYHEDADEGHILPRITVHMGTDNERTVQLTSRYAAPLVA